jgi:hypothetical protein
VSASATRRPTGSTAGAADVAPTLTSLASLKSQVETVVLRCAAWSRRSTSSTTGVADAARGVDVLSAPLSRGASASAMWRSTGSAAGVAEVADVLDALLGRGASASATRRSTDSPPASRTSQRRRNLLTCCLVAVRHRRPRGDQQAPPLPSFKTLSFWDALLGRGASTLTTLRSMSSTACVADITRDANILGRAAPSRRVSGSDFAPDKLQRWRR